MTLLLISGSGAIISLLSLYLMMKCVLSLDELRRAKQEAREILHKMNQLYAEAALEIPDELPRTHHPNLIHFRDLPEEARRSIASWVRETKREQADTRLRESRGEQS